MDVPYILSFGSRGYMTLSKIGYLFFNVFLRPRKSYYISLFADYMPVGIVVFSNQQNQFIYANKYFLDSLGLTLKELLDAGTNWIQFVDYKDSEITLKTAQKAWDKDFLGLFTNHWINQETGVSTKVTWTAYKINSKETLSYVQFDSDTLHDWIIKK